MTQKPNYEEIIQRVFYNCGFFDRGETLEQYKNRIVMVYAVTPHTGIVFTEDINDPTIVDGSMYLENLGPKIDTIKQLLVMLSDLGYKFFYANNNGSEKIKTSNKFCQKVGLQEVDENIFSIKLN
jgi:hypothetical protein